MFDLALAARCSASVSFDGVDVKKVFFGSIF